MSKKVERVLVQGTVTFQVSCNDLVGMVTPEQAADERYMEDWFIDKAFKMIDLASEESEYDNEHPVLISEKTAEKFTGEIITKEDWREIVAESKESKE